MGVTFSYLHLTKCQYLYTSDHPAEQIESASGRSTYSHRETSKKQVRTEGEVCNALHLRLKIVLPTQNYIF